MNGKVALSITCVLTLFGHGIEAKDPGILTFGIAPTRVIACEHAKSPSFITCDGSRVIKIIDAFYGRTNRNLCSYSSTTNCKAVSSRTKVIRRCNGKTKCEIPASNRVFGDPCRGVGKYTKIEFICVPK